MLDEMGHLVVPSSSIASAMHLLATQKFDLVLLDYHLPDGTSLRLSDQVACFCPNSRTILLTGSDVFPHGEHARFAPGVDWVLRKPVAMDDLRALVDYAHADAARHPTQMTALP